MERKFEIILGTGLLIAGIVLLLFVFAQMLPIAQNPGQFIRSQLPDNGEDSAPQASFAWASNNLAVTFTDTSQADSSQITTYTWDFGDGSSSGLRNPSHTYATEQDYTVRLTVTDQSGKSAMAMARVHPNQSGTNEGTSQDGDGMDVEISFEPFAVAMVFIGACMILYLVGASILKAGWNLINPKAEKITLRVKPKHIEVEPVAQPAQPQVVYAQQPTQQPPPPQYQQPPRPPQG